MSNSHTPPLVDLSALAIVVRELAFPRILQANTDVELVLMITHDDAELQALRIGNNKDALEAYYFRSDDPRLEGFYARNGMSLEHRFLRYPVAFRRISSRFSPGRPHPILKRRKPHWGVDFAASRGTPVIAVGSGRVTFAGWDGPSGRTIRIDHGDGYVSGYSHLHTIADTIRPGISVRKGQVIGTVGSTGLATGPHLHFSMSKDGRHIDPLGPDLPKRRPLPEHAHVQLMTTVAVVRSAFTSPSSPDGAPTRLAAADAVASPR